MLTVFFTERKDVFTDSTETFTEGEYEKRIVDVWSE